MRILAALLFALALGMPGAAEADSHFSGSLYGADDLSRENAGDEALASGDIDTEDRFAMRLRETAGTADVHGESWVSLVGLERELQNGKKDWGAMMVVGLALDRLAGGPVHRLSDPPKVDPPKPKPETKSDAAYPPSLARDCVAAALRTSGLGASDEPIDAIVSRARASAMLPETRLRAMRLWDDVNHTTTLATTDGTNYYDAVGANLVLEVRLTWRLDRLVYAGDEPTLERVRLERQEARSHMATRTLESLFAWQRARADAGEAAPDSHEEREAELRAAQAEATLDVLTGGWFSDWTKAELQRPVVHVAASGAEAPLGSASRSP